jgi:hypothetical protein
MLRRAWLLFSIVWALLCVYANPSPISGWHFLEFLSAAQVFIAGFFIYVCWKFIRGKKKITIYRQ